MRSSKKTRKKLPVENARASTPNLKIHSESHEYPVFFQKHETCENVVSKILKRPEQVEKGNIEHVPLFSVHYRFARSHTKFKTATKRGPVSGVE